MQNMVACVMLFLDGWFILVMNGKILATPPSAQPKAS